MFAAPRCPGGPGHRRSFCSKGPEELDPWLARSRAVAPLEAILTDVLQGTRKGSHRLRVTPCVRLTACLCAGLQRLRFVPLFQRTQQVGAIFKTDCYGGMVRVQYLLIDRQRPEVKRSVTECLWECATYFL